MQCVGQVEIDPYCQAVLKKHWPDVKRIDDIRKVTGDEFGAAELVCGGFPCQPFSCAGKRGGQADDRYLWPEMLRVIQALRPAWVLGENVAGIIGVELDKVLSDLESIGYSVQPFVIPACAVDAPQRRDRVWIVAYSEHNARRAKRELESGGEVGRSAGPEQNAMPVGGSEALADSDRTREPQPRRFDEEEWKRVVNGGEDVSDPKRARREGCFRPGVQGVCGREHQQPVGPAQWLPEPDVGRLAHGIPNRVAQLRALGNAVVPQVIEEIGRAIMKRARL